ncbi:hypothetical protein F4778DRAFT_259390 [Xylariomycetidae sp. FL2044]|nr:hypothetical protein F4778DRAFT_259390 [Xylariomycetidae sp. FL2044]
MEKKQPHDDLPPPYSINANAGVVGPSSLDPESLTYALQSQLASLPARIKAQGQARSAQQSFDDAEILEYITPDIEQFLTELGSRHTAPPLATLTLVPGTAVPPSSSLSGMEDIRRRGEIGRVARVRIEYVPRDTKSSSAFLRQHEGPSDQTWTSGREFSDWGRFGDPRSPVDGEGSTTMMTDASKMLWWRDEEMAHRLAGYLQPRRDGSAEAPKASSVVQDVVEQRLPAQKEKKGWGWGRKRVESNAADTPPLSSVAGPSGTTRSVSRGGDKVRMTVRAEEVAFRHENDFGIFESVNGWAIVVTVSFR